MSIVFLLSVILKGFGAVLEVLLQVMITRMMGLAGYGTYSTWVSAADLVYWVLFSGITKCNTFYLSNKGTELRRFKAKYYSRYVLPVLAVLALVLALEKGQGGYTVIALITGMELLVMDHSSTMMAQGQPGCALFGEYVLGRLFLVLGTLVLYKTERLSLGTLLALYVIQYAGILVLFLIKRDREPRRDISKKLSLRKWGSYQRADLIQALISQMPILLQYFFTGAFEAGIVSVVLMVKKLVNFISGPTAKVFLPEFSRMYHAGDKAGIKQCYASIMRIQMLFAGSMAVVLVGYPQVLLSILAEELLPYTKQFVGCALVFILIATLGPCSGVLQMTGNEKKDNLYREAALGVMLVLLFVMRGSRLVMLYALCVQALLEGLVKYWYVCRWMQGSAVKLKTYCIWWSVPAAVIAGGCLLHLQHSALAMLLAAGGTFAFGLVCELRPGGCLHGYWEGLKKKFEKSEYKEVLLSQLEHWISVHIRMAENKMGFSHYEKSIRYIISCKKEIANKNIVVYGAGNVGKDYIRQIIKEDLCNSIKWVDRNWKEKNSIYNIEVENPSTIKLFNYDYIVLAIYNEKIIDEIVKCLKKLNVDEKKIIIKKPLYIEEFYS